MTEEVRLKIDEAEDLARFLRDVAGKGPVRTRRCFCGELTTVEHSLMRDEARERAFKLERQIDKRKA